MKKYYFLKKSSIIIDFEKSASKAKRKKEKGKKNFINIIRECSLFRFLVRNTYLFYALKDRTPVFLLRFHCDILQ